MIGGRCQLCGRHKGAKRDGGLVAHYVAGVPCKGAGAPPLELDDTFLASTVEQLELAVRAVRLELRELHDRRANFIPPELELQQRQLAALADRLGRRLRRHRDWPARFAREMERRGYGSPPPAYLAARQLGA